MIRLFLKNYLVKNLQRKILQISNFQVLHLYRVISSSIQLLVQDLENACEPALTAMVKVIYILMFIILSTHNLLATLSLRTIVNSSYAFSLAKTQVRSRKSPTNI